MINVRQWKGCQKREKGGAGGRKWIVERKAMNDGERKVEEEVEEVEEGKVGVWGG